MPPIPGDKPNKSSKSTIKKSVPSIKPKTPLPTLTPFQYHVSHYKDGCGSKECEGSKVCFARGAIPADVLFIGEAPGESENVTGLPFYGPAGDLLDTMIESAFADFTDQGNAPKLLFTNTVGCIPRDENGKACTPNSEQMQSCKSRLQELILVADGKDPRHTATDKVYFRKGSLKVIVTVGKEAQKHLNQGQRHSAKLHRPIPIVEIVHPSAILQMNVIHKQSAIDRVVVTLYNMWAGILDPEATLTVS